MRRKFGLFLTCALALPLVVAASAQGQGNTLLVDDQTPRPGQDINIRGFGFAGTTGLNPINIRFNTRDSEPVASPGLNSLGQIDTTITVPTTFKPGWYLILATQTVTANGRQRAFTPARTRIKVEGTPIASAVPRGGEPGGLPDSPLGFLALASALLTLTAGVMLTVRRRRTRNCPQLDSQAR